MMYILKVLSGVHFTVYTEEYSNFSMVYFYIGHKLSIRVSSILDLEEYFRIEKIVNR